MCATSNLQAHSSKKPQSIPPAQPNPPPPGPLPHPSTGKTVPAAPATAGKPAARLSPALPEPATSGRPQTKPKKCLSLNPSAPKRQLDEPKQDERRYPAEHEIIGKSRVMRLLLTQAKALAPTSLPVLIYGETGTGKEAIARLLHEASGRKGALVAVNCASLNSALAEAELFGNTRGAFTGANEQRKGLFDAAEGGTLFLDEIGEMPMDVQAKFLRVLREGRFRRVGGHAETPVHVRVIAATHRDLIAMVRAGRFREDLLWRLSGGTLQLPPLRERGRDIILIARHTLRVDSRLRMRDDKNSANTKGTRLESTFSEAAIRVLLAHSWPANVRELQSVAREARRLAPGPIIQGRHAEAVLGISEERRTESTTAESDTATRLKAVLQERGEVLSTLLRSELGLPRTTLWRHMQPLIERGDVVVVGQNRGTRYRWIGAGKVVASEDTVQDDLSVNERKVLALMERQGKVKRRDVMVLLGVSSRTATRVLGRVQGSKAPNLAASRP